MIFIRPIISNLLFLAGVGMCSLSAYAVHISLGHAVVGVACVVTGVVSAVGNDRKKV